MKVRKALLLAALLVLGAFFVHVASMRPTAEDLSRARALESMLAEEFPSAPGSEKRALSAPEDFRRPDGPARLREAAVQMLEKAREDCA